MDDYNFDEFSTPDEIQEKNIQNQCDQIKELFNFIPCAHTDDLGKSVITFLLNGEWTFRSHEAILNELNISEQDFEEVLLNNSSEILYAPHNDKFFLRARALNVPIFIAKRILNVT